MREEQIKEILINQFSWLYRGQYETKEDAVQRIEKRANEILEGENTSLLEQVHFRCLMEQQDAGLIHTVLKYLDLENMEDFNSCITILYFDHLNVPLFLARKDYWMQKMKPKVFEKESIWNNGNSFMK